MRFSFVYENIIRRWKSDEEKASQQLCHLIDSDFAISYATYSQYYVFLILQVPARQSERL